MKIKTVRQIFRLLQLSILTICCQVSFAHHSPVAFNTEVTDFSLNGEIVRVDVRNPHSAMILRVTDEDGVVTDWEIEFSSINLLLRRGWDFDRLKEGDTVTCVGNPSSQGRQEMYMWSIVLSDGTEYGR